MKERGARYNRRRLFLGEMNTADEANMYDAEILIYRLRKLRSKHRLTQVQLAEKAGVSPVTISHIEQSKLVMKPSTNIKLANSLSVPYAYLRYGYVDDPTKYTQFFLRLTHLMTFRNVIGPVLAAKAQIPYRYVSKLISSDVINPSEEKVRALAEVLEFDPYYLLFESNEIIEKKIDK